MEQLTFRAWVSKYALSEGIQEIKARATHSPTMIADTRNSLACYHGEGKEWHRSRSAALVRAEEMRVAKIASLRKQIAKLEKVSFSEPAPCS